MANEKRLIVLDYDAVREAFDKEYKATMELVRRGETHLDNLAEGFTEADRVLRGLLAVDAVEVVRCKDCKHYVGMVEQIMQCAKDQKYRRPFDFCSYGERKSGAHPQKEDI